MDTVTITSSEADATASTRIGEHHAQMTGTLGTLVDTLGPEHEEQGGRE